MNLDLRSDLVDPSAYGRGALVGYWTTPETGVSATVFLRRTDGRYAVEVRDTDGIRPAVYFGTRIEADTYAKLATQEREEEEQKP